VKTEPKPEANSQETRPRLTTPDLEFDYDRSQLRDPRPTPGRVARPRREEREVSPEWKLRFYIPKPEKPPGRLDAYQKDMLFREEAFLDPSAMFHDLYVCHRKGPDGSPTYDSGGDQLDWPKVDHWMKPKPYNKVRMVRGMEKRVDKAMEDNRKMREIFFDSGKPPTNVGNHIHDFYMKDQVSKDLGVPIHQITPAHFQDWEQMGFSKVNADLWWHEPNEEEKKRGLKMLSGGKLRKDL
jgi:hypothetical protein